MHSMTGFGRGEAVAGGVIWRAELSSVNRKALELVVHLPRDVADLEPGLRNRLADKLSRGRVQCSITADRGSSAEGSLRVDESLAKQYAAHLHKLGFRSDVSDPTRWPGVFTFEQTGISAEVAQPFIRLLPLTALVDALHGVYLDGYGPGAIGREIATLTIYTVGTFALSVKLFRWR